jgi:hypothetical protein
MAVLKVIDVLHVEDFDVSDVGQYREYTVDCGKREAAVIMLPKIGDEGVVTKAFLGFQSIK